MSVEIREGTVSDDQLCGTIMSAALKREDIPRSFLKNNVLILPLRNNLRIVAYYDNKPAGFCDYVISKGHINSSGGHLVEIHTIPSTFTIHNNLIIPNQPQFFMHI